MWPFYSTLRKRRSVCGGCGCRRPGRLSDDRLYDAGAGASEFRAPDRTALRHLPHRFSVPDPVRPPLQAARLYDGGRRLQDDAVLGQPGPSGGLCQVVQLCEPHGFNAPAPAPAGEKGWVPPISMMAIIGNTHTQVPSVAPPTDPYQPNDNTVLSPFSVFWGGAITSNVGAFVQVTHNSPDPLSALTGNPVDHLNHNWSWDNADVRYANTANLGWLDLIYGITANNNPTVQDLWNTTPGWSFPQAASTLANTPGAATLIEGTFSMRVAGVGAYAMINDMLYLEVSVYRTLDSTSRITLASIRLAGPACSTAWRPIGAWRWSRTGVPTRSCSAPTA